MKFEAGSLDTLTASQPVRRGWFAGSYISADSLLHTNGNPEILWLRYKSGERKTSTMSLDPQIRTVAILVSGKLRTEFVDDQKIVDLEKQGDYLVYTAAPHVSEALEDSCVVTIR